MEGGLVASAILWAPPPSTHGRAPPFLGPFLLFPGFHDGLMVVCLKGATAEGGRNWFACLAGTTTSLAVFQGLTDLPPVSPPPKSGSY